MTAYEKLTSCFEAYKSKISFEPKVALVLGSGLGGYADEIKVVDTLDYNDLDDFPVSTVPGHKGRFVFGYVGDVPVVVMQGRVHYYEGYPMQDVVLPARLMRMMGAEILMLTNASGGLNWQFAPGDFMLITDHVSSFVPSPLIGKNIDEIGTRFPDMSCVYDIELCKAIETAATELKIPLRKGVYAQLSGPQFETPAEIRMLRTLGIDAVGMSTVCEAIAARHAGMRVCGISCVSNLACGMTNNILTHDEVQETANRVSKNFKALVTESIKSFA